MPTRRSSERLRVKRRRIDSLRWAFRAASYAWFLPKLFHHKGLPADICAIIWSFIIGPRPIERHVLLKYGTSKDNALEIDL
eukprot:SAG31_NODE_4614_length_3095_cov_76.629172_5_plen_81_part_00